MNTTTIPLTTLDYNDYFSITNTSTGEWPTATSSIAINDTNFTSAIYYNCTWSLSPIHSPYILAAFYLLYALVFIGSLIGNGVVCFIVVATPRMRTVTNYFIANLAIGDMLITLLCVPTTSVSQLQQYWPFPNLLCPAVTYVQSVSVFVSTYTLVAISVDRYVAIMWPLKPRLAKRTCALVIAGVWLFATVTGLPTAVVARARQPNDWYLRCDTYMCQEDWSTVGGDEYGRRYSALLLVLQVIVPVAVLLFTYTSIGVVIWCHRIPGEAENCRDQRIARSKRKMIKMMVAVVIVYIICWLPLHLYWNIVNDMNIELEHVEYLWFFAHWFAMSHPCYNPLIYCYMNNRFRQGFGHIFGMLPLCGPRCASAALMTHHANGRASRMSMPLTSIGGTDSTILHRNNTCTTYISTRRRNGSRPTASSDCGGGGGGGGAGCIQQRAQSIKPHTNSVHFRETAIPSEDERNCEPV